MNARLPVQSLSPVQTTTVFRSGNSQAVRIPKALQFNSQRVSIVRRGDEVVLKEVPLTMADFLAKLPHIPDWPDAPEDGPAERVDAL